MDRYTVGTSGVPASSGNGFVSEGSLPSPGQGLSLPAAIASTVWRTVQHLFLPVPSSLARPFSSHVIIHVMEMTDMQTSGEKEAEDARRKAWAEVVAELQVAVGAQTFELHFRQISLTSASSAASCTRPEGSHEQGARRTAVSPHGRPSAH